MAPRREKIDYGNPVGNCPICEIKLWDSAGGKPVIFPCNIQKCPYEDPKKQNRSSDFETHSITGSGLYGIT